MRHKTDYAYLRIKISLIFIKNIIQNNKQTVQT